MHVDDGYHASTCTVGPDRVVRHNLVRNEIFRFASVAGLRPELEKPGILPDDKPLGLSSRRRPADVFMPAWTSGSPAALDFAVTSVQRQAVIESASRTPLASADQYSDVKRSHLDTQRLCAGEGVDFFPMVAETSGAWSRSAIGILGELSRRIAEQRGTDSNLEFSFMLQRLSVLFRRCQARAWFRRREQDHDAGLFQ